MQNKQSLLSDQRNYTYARSQEQQLEQIYGFYDKKSTKKQKVYERNIEKQNIHHPYQQKLEIQNREKSQNQYHNQNQNQENYHNSTYYQPHQDVQYHTEQNINFDHYQYDNQDQNNYDYQYQNKNQIYYTSNNYHSQSFDRLEFQCERQNKYDTKITKIREYSNQYSQKISENNKNRSLNALVSASKPTRYKPTKTISEKSSSISARTKFPAHKLKPKNNNDQIQSLFVNPLTNFPNQSMDVNLFQKFYKIDYPTLFNKIQEIQKKIFILGQKNYFKDKANAQQLDQILKIIGLKASTKLGKGKSIREFKAIYKYLNLNNTQNSAKKEARLGQGAQKIESFYLSQFKQLMGYKENQQSMNLNSKNSLFGYGFRI